MSSTNSLAIKTDCGECKHCTPEQMKENAKKAIDGLLKQGVGGEVYAQVLLKGKCREYDHAINVERFRRGWTGCFPLIGCPGYVYEALKDEPGLPEATIAALHKHEESYPELAAKEPEEAVILKDGMLFSHDSEYNNLPSKEHTKQTPLAEKSSLGVFVDKNRTWVSSRDVAERFEKNHKDVIRNIKALDCSLEFTGRNFALSEYKDPTGRTLPQYLMTRDGFTFLAMGFTGARAARFKEAYINEFNRMEELLRGAPAPQNASALGERYEELNALYDAERKKSVTAMSTAAAAKRSEQAMKRRLNKALDALASLKRGQCSK